MTVICFIVLCFKDNSDIKVLIISNVYLRCREINRELEKIFNDFFGGNEICRIFATAKAKDGPFV
ncbi:hypothetical protein DWW52_13375 [Odoribacter sp. AF15-53]|mgnify:FL=1|nr:hypothetical protein DWW52_13375 [Odoribacter sp. AF15-53]